VPRAARRWTLAFVGGALVIVAAAALIIRRTPTDASGPSDKSITVVPFTNLNGDKVSDYFGEGLAEEISDALGKAGMRVIGRSSASALAARGLDAREIARQLGVASFSKGPSSARTIKCAFLYACLRPATGRFFGARSSTGS
jgi:hypothetical protein